MDYVTFWIRIGSSAPHESCSKIETVKLKAIARLWLGVWQYRAVGAILSKYSSSIVAQDL